MDKYVDETRWLSLSYVAGVMGHNEADLGFFAYQHLPDEMLAIASDGSIDITFEGFELLQIFVPIRD